MISPEAYAIEYVATGYAIGFGVLFVVAVIAGALVWFLNKIEQKSIARDHQFKKSVEDSVNQAIAKFAEELKKKE